jgi:sulfur transfer complex TusBCD TusB component (DsrH family)
MNDSLVPGSFGIIIARTVAASENAISSLELAQDLLAQGNLVGIYLGKQGKTQAAVLIANLLTKGAKIYASSEHLKASGISKERLVSGIEVVEDTYKDLVDFVMERYEKVVSC